MKNNAFLLQVCFMLSLILPNVSIASVPPLNCNSSDSNNSNSNKYHVVLEPEKLSGRIFKNAETPQNGDLKCYPDGPGAMGYNFGLLYSCNSSNNTKEGFRVKLYLNLLHQYYVDIYPMSHPTRAYLIDTLLCFPAK